MKKLVKILINKSNRLTLNGYNFFKEDFQPMNYGFKFAPDFAENAVNSMLKTVEDNSAKTYRVRMFFQTIRYKIRPPSLFFFNGYDSKDNF